MAAACAAGAAMVGGAAPAGACGGLVAPNGTIQLLKTATLAAYHDGVEHYVTSFEFAGDGAELGSIVPLPDIPSKVERGGDWTLQRLAREKPGPELFSAGSANAATSSDSAQVIYETKIDALDITILKGGGTEVGKWAVDHGYQLTPDAPATLEFYSWRSPIFMAARFDAAAARQRGQSAGDGTPIHLTIPTRNPWVPLRILGLGRTRDELINADVYLLTDRRPALLPAAPGLDLQVDERASDSLLDDLRSDKGMEWMPKAMWLTYLSVNETAGKLVYDLAVDASGRGRPWHLDAGLRKPRVELPAVAAVTPTSELPTTTLGTIGKRFAFPTEPASRRSLDGTPWVAILSSFVVGSAIYAAAMLRRRKPAA
jgi:hypothetical protein